MTTRTGRILGRAAVVGFLVLAGCTAAREQTRQVEDSWLARVPADQMGGVEAARADVRQANDEVTRAEVAVEDARRELEMARYEVEAASARIRSDEAGLRAAQARGQAGEIADASTRLDSSRAARDAAQAKVDMRAKVVEVRSAEKDVREKEVALAEAQLSLARYEALRSIGDVRAQEISEADLHSDIARAYSEIAEARREQESKLNEAQVARSQWQRLRDRSLGIGGAGEQ